MLPFQRIIYFTFLLLFLQIINLPHVVLIKVTEPLKLRVKEKKFVDDTCQCVKMDVTPFYP